MRRPLSRGHPVDLIWVWAPATSGARWRTCFSRPVCAAGRGAHHAMVEVFECPLPMPAGGTWHPATARSGPSTPHLPRGRRPNHWLTLLLRHCACASYAGGGALSPSTGRDIAGLRDYLVPASCEALWVVVPSLPNCGADVVRASPLPCVLAVQAVAAFPPACRGCAPWSACRFCARFSPTRRRASCGCWLVSHARVFRCRPHLAEHAFLRYL